MAPTKEKRFAYSLYLDMLVLMERISHQIRRRGGEEPLADTRFIKRIYTDDQLKGLLYKYRTTGFPYEEAAERIGEQIKNSSYYKNWLKTREEGTPVNDGTLWQDIFRMFIMTDGMLKESFAGRENFTLKGQERMQDMMEETFSNFMSSLDDGQMAVKTLAESMDRSRELYFRLLLLPVELTHMQELRLEQNREKFLATDEDLNPNMRFVENLMVEALSKSEVFSRYVEIHKLSWKDEDPILLEKLLHEILSSEIYKEYMSSPATDMHRDTEFWREIFRKVILPSEYFLESLEDKSVFWNDDLDIMSTFVLKTFRRIEDGEHHAVLDKFKDEEDSLFGFELLKAVLRNKDVYRMEIDNVLMQERWDRERLAFMDVLTMVTALAEIQNFPKIPLSVSVNEYVEIAKGYSTAKSGGFVHGVLAHVIRNLKEEGRLLK